MFQLKGNPDRLQEDAAIIEGGIKEVDVSGHSFDAGLRQNMNPVFKWAIRKIMIPWLERCLLKYSEDEFHQKMYGHYFVDGKRYEGFDFIADWYRNHPRKFSAFMRIARKERDKLSFSIDDEVNRLVLVLNKHGWTVYDEERTGLYQAILRLHNMIYS